MQTGNQISIQACPFGGEICRNGKRDDFKINKASGEKFVCAKWICLKGEDPQTREVIDNWMCNEAAIPLLIVEVAQMTRQTRASVDKSANEIQKQHATFFSALSPGAKERVMLGASKPADGFKPKMIEQEDR